MKKLIIAVVIVAVVAAVIGTRTFPYGPIRVADHELKERKDSKLAAVELRWFDGSHIDRPHVQPCRRIAF